MRDCDQAKVHGIARNASMDGGASRARFLEESSIAAYTLGVYAFR